MNRASALPFVLIGAAALACGAKPGEGKDIAEGKSCILGSDKSECAAGLTCVGTGLRRSRETNA